MKRILSIAVALCMMLSICVVSVGAADGTTTVDFVVSESTANAGETFTVNFDIAANPTPGFVMASFVVKYDKTAMTLDKIQTGDTDFAVSVSNPNKGTFILDNPDCSNSSATGTAVVLTFTALDTACGKYPVSVELAPGESVLTLTEDLMSEYEVANTITNGSVMVKPATNPVTDYNVTLGENFALNFLYNATDRDVITVTANDEAVPFTAADGKITIKNISAKDMDKDYTVTVNGWETTVSVKDYCEYVSDNSENTELVAVADAMVAYNAAANNYFDNEGETVEVPTFDVGNDNPRVVANSTTGGPIFYSVRLQLEDGVFVVVRMKDYNDEAISVTVDGIESAYIVEDVEGLSAVVIPVKATQYDAPIVIEAGNSSLTYSVHTYIQQKQNSSDADLVNLVNAIGWYGAATTAYVAA